MFGNHSIINNNDKKKCSTVQLVRTQHTDDIYDVKFHWNLKFQLCCFIWLWLIGTSLVSSFARTLIYYFSATVNICWSSVILTCVLRIEFPWSYLKSLVICLCWFFFLFFSWFSCLVSFLIKILILVFGLSKTFKIASLSAMLLCYINQAALPYFLCCLLAIIVIIPNSSCIYSSSKHNVLKHALLFFSWYDLWWTKLQQ